VEAKRDQVPLLAAGVAFYALLALIPALAAAVSIYGLVGDPSEVSRQVRDIAGALPSSAQDLLEEQLRRVTEAGRAGLSLSLVVAVALALWSASSGVQHLVQAIGAAYDEEEGRGAVRLRLMSLVMTAGAVVFAVLSVGLITGLPSLLDGIGLSDGASTVLELLRWPLLALVFMVALAALYRWAPDRDEPKWRWTTPGAIAATVGWIIGSIAFALYADHLGSFNRTYGALAGVIVLMLWLLLTSTVVLFGAEINAESERQTAVDSTVDRPRPLGRRGAHAADTLGPVGDDARS
jgi:membrane protein